MELAVESAAVETEVVVKADMVEVAKEEDCLLYTSPSPRDS